MICATRILFITLKPKQENNQKLHIMEKSINNNEKKVMEAISGSSLKVSYKMKSALMRIAKKNTPIESIEFFVEQIPQNQHGNGYADGAEVYYMYTAPNHHSTVSFDGDIWP